MKKILLLSGLIFLIVSALSAQPLTTSTYGLNGYYDISNWNIIPNSGTINTSGAPNSLVFVSGNSGDTDTTYISIPSPNWLIVKIGWTYTTADSDGPRWDYPVYILNGVMHQFSSYNVYGSDVQSGLETFTVKEGDTFGIGVYTVDGVMGSCTVNSIAFEFKTVPVALSTVLIAFVLIGVTFFVRKRIRESRVIA